MNLIFLHFPDMNKNFILDVDAACSNYAIGVAFSQINDAGVEQPVAFASRLLSEAERNYSVTRKELLAVKEFCD